MDIVRAILFPRWNHLFSLTIQECAVKFECRHLRCLDALERLWVPFVGVIHPSFCAYLWLKLLDILYYLLKFSIAFVPPYLR